MTPWREALRDGGKPLAAILVVAAVLRGVALNEQLWLDEVLMLHDFVQKPLAATVASYPNDNNHPLYSLLASLAARACGESAWSLRLPAAAFGLLSIAATFVLARAVASRRTALLAAALLAASYHHVWFSQNARGYTALMFFATVATHAFLAARAGSRRAPVVQALSLGFGAYAHLTGAFVGVAQAAISLLDAARSRRDGAVRVKGPLLGVLGGGAVALLLHAPMLGDLWRFFVARPDRVATASEWKSPWWTVEETLRGLGFARGIPAVALGAVALIGGLVVLRRMNRAAPGFALAATLPAAVGAIATLALGRHLWPRFFFFSAGFVFIVAAEGMLAAGDACARRVFAPARAPAVAAILGVALVAASAVTVPRAWGPKQDFVGARAYVEARRKPGDVVLTAGLATWPYEHLYAPAFTPVRSKDELDGALAGRAAAHLLYHSRIFLESRTPDLWAAIQSRFEEETRFSGTLGDGDLVVCRLRAP